MHGRTNVPSSLLAVRDQVMTLLNTHVQIQQKLDVVKWTFLAVDSGDRSSTDEHQHFVTMRVNRFRSREIDTCTATHALVGSFCGTLRWSTSG